MMAALLLVFVLILSGTLLEARETYEKKEEELKEKEGIIAEQQDQIDAVIGVRSDLIDALRLEFADSDFSVSVDSQTGAIMFPSSLLFESGKYELRSSGVEFLEAFLPKYFSILLGDDFSPYVAEIIIEGHTDTEGGYMYNLQLSQNRALAVATYCLDENSEILSEEQTERLRVLLTANGRSWSSPVYYENGEVNMEASRRVEIKFRLKDQEMMEELAEILEGF
jgi:chemotaxis protein MotB